MQSFPFAHRLGSQPRFLTLTKWQDEDRIDIREWDETGTYPSKKGISLPIRRWNTLCSMFEDVNEAREKMIHKIHKQYIVFKPGNSVKVDLHIGGLVFVKAESGFPCIDIRQYWVPEGESVPKPTKKGISLCQEEWDSLVLCQKKLNEEFPFIKEIPTCLESEDHQNQEGMLNCPECNPAERNQW